MEEIKEIISDSENTVKEAAYADGQSSEMAGNCENAYSQDNSVFSEEISAIKSRLDKIDSRSGFISELRSLISLIPDADIRTLDVEAYEAIEKGENLLYAYLLSEKRRYAANEANKNNAVASTGNADGSGDGLFTLEEIKSMDRKTVRRNFDKVMRSLERGI